MCPSFAGIPCEEVSGYSKGYSYNIGDHFTGSSNHAWNAVYLEDQWHLLDSTWGAGKCGVKDFQFSFEYDEYYFLTHPALFILNHFPEDKKWQLLNSTVSLKEFEKSLYVKGEFYNLGLTTIKPDMSQIKTENGTVSISIEGTSPTLFLYNLNGTQRDGILTLKPCGMKLDLYPQRTGTHEVMIFAKTFLDETPSYKYICEYQLHCHTLNKEIKVPVDLVSPVGHSLMAEKAGLLQPSVSDPIVNTEDGKCSFRFLLNKDLCFTADLSTAAFEMSEQQKKSHIFIAREGKQVPYPAGTPLLHLFQGSHQAMEDSMSHGATMDSSIPPPGSLVAASLVDVDFPVFCVAPWDMESSIAWLGAGVAASGCCRDSRTRLDESSAPPGGAIGTRWSSIWKTSRWAIKWASLHH
ncbi:KY peptidase, partial [Polypterus senegalus]